MASESTPVTEIAEVLLRSLSLDPYQEVKSRLGVVGHPAYNLNKISLPKAGMPAPRQHKGGTISSQAESTPPPKISKKQAATSGSQICPSCSSPNPANGRFCSNCGFDLRQAEPEPAAEAAADAKPAAESEWTLVTISETGNDGERIKLQWREMVIGRSAEIRFPSDSLLSPKHARLTVDKERLYIDDLFSLNGTFLKLRDPIRLEPGDIFLMGRQLVRFDRFEQEATAKTRAADGTRYLGSPPPSGAFKLVQLGIAGTVQDVYCLPEGTVIIGRERGDIVFRNDQFMSSTHAQIEMAEDGNFYLSDLKSSNGTWVKIWERRQLVPNDFIFVGQQLFRVEG